MTRYTTEETSRYDTRGDVTKCYFCPTLKTNGWDYTPLPKDLMTGERGTKVRGCNACLGRIHYYNIRKNNGTMSLEAKFMALNSKKRSDTAPGVVSADLPGFALAGGLLVPTDMGAFLDENDKPTQYYLPGPIGQVLEVIELRDLEAAQAVISLRATGVSMDIVQRFMGKLSNEVPPETIAILRRRLDLPVPSW